MVDFTRLGLAEPLVAALASFGFSAPTTVQAAAVPIVLGERDAFIESETGTGKTFAYLAPAMQVLSTVRPGPESNPGIVVAAPTQELAVQIGREAERLAAAAGLELGIAVVLGGTPIQRQLSQLHRNPAIVVGTLGRLVDLVKLGKLRMRGLRFLVLDEADRLMARETEESARALLNAAPSRCAKLFVSATLPERVRRELRPYLRDPAELSSSGESVLAGSIEHWCFYCDSRKRLDFLRRFEAALHPSRCLVFISQATRVPEVAERLEALGLPVSAIHASMEKEARRVSLERFSRGELRYLVTSDLGARGLDIPAISHIVNLDLPEDPIVYTHRAGRTGRAGERGVSVVLADGVELARASKIAVRGGFTFRCKVLQTGEVLEPTTEDFFAQAAEAEQERLAAKAARMASETVQRPGPARRPKRVAPPERHERRPNRS